MLPSLSWGTAAKEVNWVSMQVRKCLEERRVDKASQTHLLVDSVFGAPQAAPQAKQEKGCTEEGGRAGSGRGRKKKA